MAQRTGLEPATPGVTGRYSNRLNYRCASVDLRPIQLIAPENGLDPLTGKTLKAFTNPSAS